jgi:hypothetical protein
MITKEQPKLWKGIHKGGVKQTWRNGVGRIKVMALPVLFSFHKARKWPHSSFWLPRHLRQYSLNIGLSVLDVPGECIWRFVMAIEEGGLSGTIPQ